MPRMMRRKEMLSVTGISASTQWREEKAGRFPARRQLTSGIVAWDESEIEAWLTNRKAVTKECVKTLNSKSRRDLR